MKLSEIAQMINGKLIGENVEINGVSDLEYQQVGAIAYAENAKNLNALSQSEVSALIVGETIQCDNKPYIQVSNPKAAFADVLKLFSPYQPYRREIYPNTYIESGVKIGKEVTVLPFTSVMDDTVIGDHTVIYSQVFIGKNVRIGKNCIIKAGVKIDDHTQIGDNVIIHHNAVIGGEGFGFIPDGGKNHKIPQIGTIRIGNDVEIGACVTVDRSTIGETVIGDRVKIDNLVQIAHNVKIDEGTMIASQSGVAGSSAIGKNCLLAGQVGVSDHVTIGDNVIVMAQAGVDKKKIESNKILLGTPARDVMLQRRIYASVERLPDLIKDARNIKKQLEGNS